MAIFSQKIFPQRVKKKFSIVYFKYLVTEKKNIIHYRIFFVFLSLPLIIYFSIVLLSLFYFRNSSDKTKQNKNSCFLISKQKKNKKILIKNDNYTPYTHTHTQRIFIILSHDEVCCCCC